MLGQVNETIIIFKAIIKVMSFAEKKGSARGQITPNLLK